MEIQDEVAHYELSHLDLYCLPIQLLSFLALEELMSILIHFQI